MSSLNKGEKLKEIDQLIRRCKNKEVHKLLLLERMKLQGKSGKDGEHQTVGKPHKENPKESKEKPRQRNDGRDHRRRNNLDLDKSTKSTHKKETSRDRHPHKSETSGVEKENYKQRTSATDKQKNETGILNKKEKVKEGKTLSGDNDKHKHSSYVSEDGQRHQHRNKQEERKSQRNSAQRVDNDRKDKSQRHQPEKQKTGKRVSSHDDIHRHVKQSSVAKKSATLDASMKYSKIEGSSKKTKEYDKQIYKEISHFSRSDSKEDSPLKTDNKMKEKAITGKSAKHHEKTHKVKKELRKENAKENNEKPEEFKIEEISSSKVISETQNPKHKVSSSKMITTKSTLRTQRANKSKKTEKNNPTKHVEENECHPQALPTKVFTEEEIAQMSRPRRTITKPGYLQPPNYHVKTSTESQNMPQISPLNKSTMWKEVAVSKTPEVGTKTETETVVQPAIELLKRGDFNASSGSSTISQRLMKLRENKEGNKTTQESLQNPTSAIKSGKNDLKSTSEKRKHKILRWQQSAPATLEEGNTKYLEIGNSETETSDQKFYPKGHHNHVEANTTGPVNKSDCDNSRVVFRVDLDNFPKKGQKTRGLSSFFRQRVMKTKSTENRFQNCRDSGIQTNPWEVSGLYRTEQSQTARNSFNVSTQTFPKVETTATQTYLQMNSVAIQSVLYKLEAQTQTMSSGVTSETQTEDEDSPVWGLENRLSLDRLVRTRGKRKSKNNLSSEDINTTGKPEKDEKQLQRSSTLPNKGRHKEIPETKKSIKSFNWSQTDKFVKVIVSYSGAHLVPVDMIKLSTNGINLRLKINTEETASTSNANSNNNNSNTEYTDAGHAELFLPRLRHFVSGLSYTVQSDMLTVLLRKQKVENWDSLEFKGQTKMINETI